MFQCFFLSIAFRQITYLCFYMQRIWYIWRYYLFTAIVTNDICALVSEEVTVTGMYIPSGVSVITVWPTSNGMFFILNFIDVLTIMFLFSPQLLCLECNLLFFGLGSTCGPIVCLMLYFIFFDVTKEFFFAFLLKSQMWCYPLGNQLGWTLETHGWSVSMALLWPMFKVFFNLHFPMKRVPILSVPIALCCRK